jgi:hypothetical protein
MPPQHEAAGHPVGGFALSVFPVGTKPARTVLRHHPEGIRDFSGMNKCS